MGYDIRASAKPNEYELVAGGSVVSTFGVSDVGRSRFSGPASDVADDVARWFAKTLAKTAQ